MLHLALKILQGFFLFFDFFFFSLKSWKTINRIYLLLRLSQCLKFTKMSHYTFEFIDL